ncbi:hypothetical protein ABPG74_007555 [Tetrahymena malaccensis]
MKKSSVVPQNKKVSQFAQQNIKNHDDENDNILKQQSSIKSDSNSAASINQNQQDQQINANYQGNSQGYIDVMKEQEQILLQKGLNSPPRDIRRYSVDSKMSESFVESEANSDSDKDSGDDNNSLFGTPEQNELKKDFSMPPMLELDQNQKQSSLQEKESPNKDQKQLVLQKESSKQTQKSKKESTNAKKQVVKKKKKSNKQKQVYQSDDFTLTNQVGRNILHRQCLKQNVEMIKDLLVQYKKLKELEYDLQQKLQQQNFDVPEQSPDQALQDYINQLDNFGNSPLILCCIQQFDDEINFRYECLKLLLEAGADVNHRNPRTLWSALHWSSHYGDDKSIQLLLTFQSKELKGLTPQQIQPLSINQNYQFNKTYQCFPDQQGLFPLDLAGISGNQDAVNLLLENLIQDIKEVEKIQNNQNLLEDEMQFYQSSLDQKFMRQQRFKYLKSPLLKSRFLYWASYYPGQKSKAFITAAFGFTQIYVMAQLPHQQLMTPLHAAAKNKNVEAINILADNIRYQNIRELKDWIKREYEKRLSQEFFFSKYQNSVLQMIPEEDRLYKPSFVKQIQKFAKWEHNFIMSYRKYEQDETKHTYIDQKDAFGNTALHLASINGFEEGVIKLLNCGADMETGNKEGWRPRELVQFQSIRQIYYQALEKNQGLSLQLKNMNKQLQQTIKKYKVIEEEQIDNANKKREKDLFAYGTKLFLPDFVIVFSLGTDIQKAENNQNRMNFQISILRKSKFNVYLLQSVYPDRYYLLIGMPEKYLQQACKENKMQMKLIDSYDYEPYSLDQVTNFEPFRSKQRQEIIEMQLNKIVNLQDLKSQGLISQYYKMHTYGGIARIKYQWVDDTNWYWPQPLNQMDDYLLEDKNQNFTSVTLLRQYFGEKIAFFFGWKSFITCFMTLIAIPGLALQIYVILQDSDDYNNYLVSFYVLYVMIWSTIIVEFWKRKTSEINYRWGTLDMMNNPDILNKILKEDFVGDECISAVTGGLTKYQKKSRTIIKFLISIPILFGLMALVVYIFIAIDDFKQKYTSPDQTDFQNNLYKAIAGVLQGVGIQVLNFIYTYLARYFAQLENHKYIFQYERSIIYKLMSFKVLNSYFALFYIAYIQKDSNFQTLFYMLLPIMLIKQINYTILNVWLPIFLYNRAEKNYFKQVNKKIIDHENIQGQVIPEKKKENQDIIEQYWNDISKEDMKNLSRAVISLQEGEEVKGDKNDPNPTIKLIKYIDVDSIELNSLRQEFLDTVNFYADGFIDLGYITLFASAFPIGPFIALIMNSLEIRNKLNVFMYILKRPTCQRCAGIGDWLFIWETFSFVSVITNIGLLYYKDQKLIDLFLDPSNYSTSEFQTIKIWLYICLGIAIVILKYIFQELIQDKPEWIMREEERWAYLEQIQKEQDEKLLQNHKKIKEVEEKKKQVEIQQLKKRYEDKIAEKDEAFLDLQEDLKYYKEACPPEAIQRRLNKDQNLNGNQNQLGKSNLFKAKSEYELKEFGVFRSTYIKIERELLIQRMKQIENLNVGTIMICNECGKKLSVFECIECDLTFCKSCFDDYHNFIQKNNHQIHLLNIKHEDQQLYQKYNILHINGENSYLLEENRLESQSRQTQMNSNINSSKINKNKQTLGDENWRKLEYFVLPTYEKSPQFSQLKEIFELFKSEYIDNNGIDGTNEQIDFTKVFKLKEKPDSKGKFMLQESRAFRTILNMTEFNIEEKLFLNRIAFLVFKRYRQKVTFKNFYSLCKILQEGFSEQKFILLLDFIDEDDSQEIDKDEIKKIFYTSFLQTCEDQKKIDPIIDNLFVSSFNGSMSKLEIGKKFIYSQEQNPVLYSFLVSLVQDRKN